MEEKVEKKTENKKSHFKLYYITLIVLSVFYLILNTYQFLRLRTGHDIAKFTLLFMKIIVITSTALLIIALTDCVFINNKYKEAATFSIFFALLIGVFIIARINRHTSSGSRMKLIFFIVTSGINMSIILFYSLSLKTPLKKQTILDS